MSYGFSLNIDEMKESTTSKESGLFSKDIPLIYLMTNCDAILKASSFLRPFRFKKVNSI